MKHHFLQAFHLKLNNSSKYFAGKINKKQDSYINMDQGFLPILIVRYFFGAPLSVFSSTLSDFS